MTADASSLFVLTVYLPPHLQASLAGSVSSFAAFAISPDTLALAASAEQHPPTVQTHSAWGERADRLITSSAWQALQAAGIRAGIVATAYGDSAVRYAQYARVLQFLRYHAWSGSSASVTCPSAMTDGAASLLARQLARPDLPADQRAVFAAAHARLTSTDPEAAWTSGQWMTERAGGSDVRGTETLATLDAEGAAAGALDADGGALGPWRVDGFKWFSSATDAQMTVLLAQTPSGGLSAFFAPTRRLAAAAAAPAGGPPATELNGIRIQRLKSKLGTRPLPTAELELRGLRAHLLGPEGAGVREISTVLNITRLHNAVSAVGSVGRGLGAARAFARVRRVAGGTLLRELPAHVATLADLHVEYRAMTHLAFFTAALLGATEHSPSASQQGAGGGQPASPLYAPHLAPLLLRAATPLAKALTARAASTGLAESMEALGGVGYLENADPGGCNVAGLFRDASVLSIWEGTTNVMAGDLVRALKGRGGGEVREALAIWVGGKTKGWEDGGWWAEGRSKVDGVSARLLKDAETRSAEELGARGRRLLSALGWVVCAVLLGEDARRDGDGAATEVCRRWLARDGALPGEWGRGWEEDDKEDWKERVEWDRKIVFGEWKEEVGRKESSKL